MTWCWRWTHCHAVATTNPPCSCTSTHREAPPWEQTPPGERRGLWSCRPDQMICWRLKEGCLAGHSMRWYRWAKASTFLHHSCWDLCLRGSSCYHSSHYCCISWCPQWPVINLWLVHKKISRVEVSETYQWLLASLMFNSKARMSWAGFWSTC